MVNIRVNFLLGHKAPVHKVKGRGKVVTELFLN